VGAALERHRASELFDVEPFEESDAEARPSLIGSADEAALAEETVA
jgi:hypothetical protein